MATSDVGPAGTLASGVVTLCTVGAEGVAVTGCEQKFQDSTMRNLFCGLLESGTCLFSKVDSGFEGALRHEIGMTGSG